MPESDDKLLERFQRSCPLTHKALAGRRYLLPNRCEDSNPNQEIGLQQRQLVLLACALLPPEQISFPRRCELINIVKGLKCDLPTVYVDSDLAQALVRTELQEDFLANELRLPWPGGSFRYTQGLAFKR